MKKKLKRKLLLMLVTSDTDYIVSYLNKLAITRSGIAFNPLQTYNYTGSNVFNANELVTMNGIATDVLKSKTYDFANKVAGVTDLVNCPMKIYNSYMSTLQNPSNYTGSGSTGWGLYNDGIQSDIDKLKVQDGNSLYTSNLNNGAIMQLMVELDLTDLATKYGGNANLKNMLRGITTNAWVMASGSNSGVLTNGVQIFAWNGSSWTNVNTNAFSSISNASWNTTNTSNFVNANNKLYILIASQYASNGVIQSSISLDYISIKLDYAERNFTKQGSPYIAGDTETFEYDFFTKVAGSSVECPLKFYRNANISLVSPTDVSWNEEVSQTELDKLKTQDGTSRSGSTSSNGAIYQYLAEVDLTPLATALGGNSALKSLLKSMAIDGWCIGSGSNGGTLANGVQLGVYDFTTLKWSQEVGISVENLTNTITKITKNIGANPVVINSNNKVYALISSKFASDGTIPSSVSLDYLKVTVQLNRVVDTVSPISVNLPKYFGVVIKGFSPMWDNNYNIKTSRVFEFAKDTNNKFALLWDIGVKKFTFSKVISNVWTQLFQPAPTFNKNQVYNFLVGQNSSGMFMYLLKNNGTLEKVTNTDMQQFIGQMNLYVLQRNDNTNQADSFLDNLTLIDLEKMGKVKFGQELVVNGDFSNGGTGWTIQGGTWDFSNNKAIGTSVGMLNQFIPVTPNSQYKLSDLITSDGGVYVGYYKADKTTSIQASTYFPNSVTDQLITTPALCDYLKIVISANIVNATFDNISLKQVLSDGFTDDEAESILRGDDRYYVTSKADFTNKISGSTVANPHISKRTQMGANVTVLQNPSAWTGIEVEQAYYDENKVLNNLCMSVSNNVNGTIAQQLFSFDVIAHLERKYGTLPCPQDLPSKIAWAKANIKQIIGNWYGFGLANGVNKAYFQVFKVDTNAWTTSSTTNTTSSPSLITFAFSSISDKIDTNGFVHFLAYTDAVSQAGNTATIYTDYISLDVTAKIIPVNPYMPNPELFDINKVTLHANASLSNGVITLNATGTYQGSRLNISVLPNNVYTVSGNVTGTNGRITGVYYYNNVVLGFATAIGVGTNSMNITMPSNCNKFQLTVDNNNATSGTFTFSNISFKRKD